ncbi:LLM class flavin-dependent oxidoreductase [Paractinoplanes atraurantiacus]|uniref:Flavin-dependent oxidoreductase, luciferase family (Includes alkanesulfonate monooxygenase SsuD and methylene tetrahydromethanopterin reductase) n=1 Tax=Paractinoplanes atraurantiacus TaxID=1036182 RepID=A0A285K8U6_9ACTN|nr:LLM class flavin-dependent oxidoreductase [Actinoplanes atraurantiacus]SNY69019.1 Flavin-dependent oxidoreductase, luciferase family (includes alkanesulfonate monooxygenase SsuD and methylene tetrahydromethanopterin reductase) [Actinoplanes atraurantiacus]
MGAKIDAVMWPDRPWRELRGEWERAERLGIGRGWLWDHLVLGGRPVWHDAYAVLAAAAATTTTIGVGTMVTAPNFRHPVTTAKAALALDDVSGGRFVLGLGAGGPGDDAEALGTPPLSAAERGRRFVEFTEHVHTLLTEPAPTLEGEWFTARAAGLGGGLPRRPPLAVAATGPRGIALAAERADWFVTQDIRKRSVTPQAEVARQFGRLREACSPAGRAMPSTVVVLGYGGEQPLASIEAFRDCVGRYTELGATRVAVLWPRGDDAERQFAVLEKAELTA